MRFDYGTKADYYVAVDDPAASDSNPGTEARPFKTLKKACGVAKAGDTTAIKEGTYREALMPQHSGEEGRPVTFQAYADDVVHVKGSVEVKGFQKEGENLWVKRPWTRKFYFNEKWGNVSEAPFKRSSRLEQVYLDERPLDWVPSREELKPGHFVWGNGELVLCPHELVDDINDHLVEVTELQQVLSVWQGDPRGPDEYRRALAEDPDHRWSRKKGIKENIDHIHVKGLRFRHATHLLNRSGCRFDGDHWLMENCYVEYMNATGVTPGDFGVVRNCVIRCNGQGGISVRGRDCLFENVVTMYNNRKLYRIGWGGAGNKLCHAEGTRLRNVLSCFNHGSGIWFDINCRGCVVENCVVFGNRPVNAGYFWEISYDATFRDNVDFASRQPGGGFYGASAVISCSQDAVFEDNVFIGGTGGLSVGGGRPRGEGEKWISVNNLFRGNLVVEPSNVAISVRDNGHHNSAVPEANNRFAENTFLIDHGATRVRFAHEWIDSPVEFDKVNSRNARDNRLVTSLRDCDAATRRRLDEAFKAVLNSLGCAEPELDLKLVNVHVEGIWPVGTPGSPVMGYFIEGGGAHYMALDTEQKSGGEFDIVSGGAGDVTVWDCPPLVGPHKVEFRRDGARITGRVTGPFALLAGLGADTIALSSAVDAYLAAGGRRTNEILVGAPFTVTVELKNPLTRALRYEVSGDGTAGDTAVVVAPGETERVGVDMVASEGRRRLEYLIRSDRLPDIRKRLTVKLLRVTDVPRVARLDVTRYDPALESTGAALRVGADNVLRDIYDERGGYRWESEDDLSADVRLTWNEKALYAVVRVTDNQITANPVPHQGDCVELFLDGRVKGFGQPSYSRGVYQIFLQPPGSERWGPVPWKSPYLKRGLTANGKRLTGGYLMAVELPWALFPDFRPAPGNVVGIDFALDDADGQPRRKAQMVWRGAADNHKNASRFGRVRLE